jgi:phospholipid/cholesterol/gamma-HCH transport system ATP-binding protein
MKRQAIKSLRFENLLFSYEPGKSPAIFNNVTADMPANKAVWIRAPGQRGKSTLLKIMAGLLSPTGGRYLINGANVCDMSFEEFLPYRLSMGYGFEFGGLLSNKTLFENLLLPLEYHNFLPHDEAVERVNETIRTFGLGWSKDQRPFSASGSQRKLTCVLRPFMHWPQVVFLDDPTTGLKQDNLNDLYHFVEEGYVSRGLRQVFFTGESAAMASRLGAEELVISSDWFTARSAA